MTAPRAARTAQTAAPTRSSGSVRLETHGGALVNILRARGAVADVARARMRAEGVSVPDAGSGAPIPAWFPLKANLRVLDEIARVFGDEAVFEIGSSVPQHATFPPAIHDLRGALDALDVAFHLNHQRDGVVMYDASTRQMLEGIGHYRFERDGSETFVCASTSVYPCSFDRGLVSGLCARFEAGATVYHAPGSACRQLGASICRYLIGPRGPLSR